MDWRQVNAITEAYNTRQESLHRESWEQTRMVMYQLTLPYLKKGVQFSNKDVIQFPWEQENDSELILSDKEAQEALRASMAHWEQIEAKTIVPKKTL